MWRCTGLGWRDGRPGWTWWHPVHGARSSPLRLGGPLSLEVAADAVRTCSGVWRAGRGVPCPYRERLRPEALRDQCERCTALDRSYSVAADTRADDPRAYAVYLAWFGPGLHKVGITAAERGAARLLEQAAVCFTFLGEGPLMTARRTEAILGAALGVPDRVSAAAKRATRHTLPAAGERAAELRSLHASVTALLPDTLRPRPFQVVDHAALFGLDPAPPPLPAGRVTALPPGTVLHATLRAAAGGDLYLETPDPDGRGAGLLLDTRLARGWPLRRPAAEGVGNAPTAPTARPKKSPQPLF